MPGVTETRQRAPRHHQANRTADCETDCRGPLRILARPPDIAEVLRSADEATRADMVGDLQRRFGNAVVSRFLDPALDRRPQLQRYAVNLPVGTADCMVVVNWLNRHSPYIATSGWAKTSVRFSWAGPLSFDGTAPDLTVTVSDPGVTMAKSVDMPTWNPTAPVMRAAWSSMTATLRAHETEHEVIATTWKATLLDRLTNLSLSVASRTAGTAAVTAEWNSWIAEHQAEQDLKDPFTAMLDCSAAETESAPAEATPAE
ncbi:MAG TPA: DUF922 domain-containing protein [Candidatus Eisenbacteria bacterium]|nr:DUF922 domain-containing protein [Candidatus Eisenbacteria bacterium]